MNPAVLTDIRKEMGGGVYVKKIALSSEQK